MTTVLHINSSIRNQDSISRKLTHEFLAQWKANKPNDVIIERDVNANPLPHLTEAMFGAFITAPEARTSAQTELVKVSDTLIDEMFAADVLVIGAPMYNFSVPSTLKAWIDHVARAGRTFKYTENGPVGLLTGKKAYVVTATGGFYSEGAFKAYDFLNTYLRSVLGFIGITDVTFVQAEGLALGDESIANAVTKNRAVIDNLIKVNQKQAA
jgi:FMN-dependent NADH-azoreductase